MLTERQKKRGCLSGSIARKSHERFGLCRVEIWRGSAEPRFQIPLIKPDGRISRIAAFGQGFI
jgi:hypothetical protein